MFLRRSVLHRGRFRRHIETETKLKIPLGSVVKVSATTTSPNFFLPWQKKASRDGTGSGFVLQTEFGNCLITNAHVVADSSYIFVRKALSAIPHRAKVVALSHEADLALLEVDQKQDTVFWKGDNKTEAPVVGLTLGELPQLQDHVSVVGFPAGGDGVSVTRGVVSRIEPIQYAHASVHLLGIQIDAAINPGNSGGPALIEGKDGDSNSVAGVAFQCLVGADNIGYIIPAPVINHFLTQYQLHKRYTGFPQMGISWQPLENPSLRKFFGLEDHVTGIVITRISNVSPSSTVIQPLDILLSIEGHTVANNGTIHFRNGERVFFNYLFVKKFVGDCCHCQVLRDGKVLDVSFALLSSHDLSLIPTRVPENRPSYLVVAGLVFTRLTIPYLQEFSTDEDNWVDMAPRSLVHKALHAIRESLDEEVVILSQVLADEINTTYSHFANVILKKFNGVKIKNMKQLAALVSSSTEEFLRFDFSDNLLIVLDRSGVAAATKRVLFEYTIPAAASDDLTAVRFGSTKRKSGLISQRKKKATKKTTS